MEWTFLQLHTLEIMKSIFMYNIPLWHPDHNLPFSINTDAYD